MATLLEFQAKAMMEDAGFATPIGRIVRNPDEVPDAVAHVPGPPWMVKAQVSGTGRAAVGGVVSASNIDDVSAHVDRLLLAGVDGRPCPGVLVEQRVPLRDEWFVAALVDPWGDGIRVTCSFEGGTGVEERLASSEGYSHVFPVARPPTAERLLEIWGWPTSDAASVRFAEYAERICGLLVEKDLLLIEINPVGVDGEDRMITVDAHVTTDDAAAPRQPWVADFEDDLAIVSPARAWRMRWGGDFKVLDRDGEVGLLNTGAGTGMLLIDELARRDVRCFNFSDIRAGTPRRRTERLRAAVDAILGAPRLRVVIVNIHAGITDLSAVAPDLETALRRIARHRTAIVRLEGRGSEEAARTLAAIDGIVMAESLPAALDHTVRECRSAA